VAPAWCRDKSRVLTAIKAELARRGSRQGSAWKNFAGHHPCPEITPPSPE
jgi:radical SAM superfamily enzyme